MKINSYQIDEASQLKPFAPEEVQEAIQRPDAIMWVDLQAFGPGELEEWLAKIGIEGLPKRLCLEALDRPGFYPLKNDIFMVVRILAGPTDADEADHLAFLCRENLLLTLHHKPLCRLEQRATEQGSDAWLPEGNIAGVVAALLTELSLECQQRTSVLRTAIIALEERMELEPGDVAVEDIMGMRTELFALERVVSEQLPCLQALNRSDKPFFELKSVQGYINSALAGLQSADRAADRFDTRINILRSAFQMHAQEKATRRLGALTILSVIFMPLTFMAGIYGMNFEVMPELEYRFAYPLTLAAMVLIALGMCTYFWKRGWFD